MTRIAFPLLLLGGLAGLAPAGVAQVSDVQAPAGSVNAPRGSLFIQNLDSVWTAAGEVLEHVSISVRDGVIRRIVRDHSPPRGVLVIDGRGLTAIPGLVDEHSHTAMDRSSNEGSAPVVPEVRVLDALDPTAFGIYQALSGGVTSALILHGSANPIGGQAAIIKMRWGMDRPEQLLVEGAPRVVKFALGENVTRKNSPGNPQRYPASRAGVESIYDQAFTAAQAYRDAWQAYRNAPQRFRIPPRRDLRLEALVDIMEGKIRVHAHSYRSDEIVMLLGVAERYGFTIDAFTHVLEGYKVADELAEHGAGASTFADWWAYKLEAYDAIPYNAAIMHQRGVLTSLNSDIPTLQPTLVYELNKPVKYGGVSREDALRMLTLYPARQLKIDDKVGSLEAGKQADIVLLSGDPFNTYSRVEKTIVDGVVYYDRQREAETRDEPVRGAPVVRAVPETTPPISRRPRAAAASGGGFGTTASGAVVEQGAITALVGGTVHPVSRTAFADGVVVMQGKRITAVGPRREVQIPTAARVVDVTSRHVYPGMIDPLTQIGMIEIAAVGASRDDREVGRYNPHLRALSSIHPHSQEIAVTRANGVTTVMSVAGAGIIRGHGSVIQLRGDTPEQMAIRPLAALVISFPSPSGEVWDEPEIKGARLEELVAAFERAGLYAQRQTTRDDPTARFEPQVQGREDVFLQAMVPAVTGRLPVFFEARNERDIRTVLLFANKFPDVRPVIVGGDHAYRVAAELAERDIPVVVGSALGAAMDRDDPVTAGYENAGRLHAAGVDVAFTTQDYANVRNLPYHAARSVAFGMPVDAALRGVTLTAAEILGLGEDMGSLDVGKRADIIVTTGDPLQIVTQVERIFIGGDEVPVTSKHTDLWARFRDR